MEAPAANDAELRRAMQAVAQGDADAFRTIAEALEPRLDRFFAQFGVAAADRQDLFQESCLRLYRAAGSYDATRPFLPWALTVARRVMLNWHRALKPEAPLDEAEDLPSPERGPDRAAESDLWQFARRRLPAETFELLWLCYGERLEPAEIAAVTGRSGVHVRVLLYRARAALAHALEQAGETRYSKRR